MNPNICRILLNKIKWKIFYKHSICEFSVIKRELNSRYKTDPMKNKIRGKDKHSLMS